MRSHLLALFLSIALTGVAEALPVTYSESIGGDLSSGGSPLTTFAFDVGANTVSGTTGIVLPSDVLLVDLDSFAFTIAPGTQLVAAMVVLADSSFDAAGAGWQFREGSLGYIEGNLVDVLDPQSPGSDSVSGGPFGAGSYNVSGTTFGANSLSARAGYTFTFTVRALPTSVPEPATLALVALALLGIGFSRRKRVYIP